MEMQKMDSFWDEQLVNQAHAAHRHGPPAVQQAVVGTGSGGTHSPYERNLNFATVAVEDGEYGFPKKKTVRDPLSHRIIEKRRRDRMNNCLADLARLLPPSSLRKGRGRIEKTEIVELAIKHLRHLQCHPCPLGDKCEFSGNPENQGGARNNSPPASCSSSSTSSGYHSSQSSDFRLGFQECLSELMHFLVEQEGWMDAGDSLCLRLVKHLNTHCDTVLRDHWGNQGKIVPGFRRAADLAKNSGGSPSSGYLPNGSSSGSDGNGGNDGEGTEPFALPVQNPPHNLSVEGSRNCSVLDYEAENSCSSTPLSIETSDVLSCDGKNTSRSSSKPPIPSIICSHSSNNSRIPINSGSPANGSTNGRSSDDGSANSSTSSAHRYKFKSNIKQRFTADCQTKPDDGTCYGSGGSGKNNLENDRDMDGISDSEDVRDERISGMEESAGQVGAQSGEEDGDMKQGSLSEQAGEAASNKSLQQISANGTLSSSLLDKTGYNNSGTNHSSITESKSVSDAASAPLDLQNQKGREAPEVKPSPEELLSAIHNLSSPNGNPGNKATLPFALNGENGEDKGISAFILHEKSGIYIPLQIFERSIITQVANMIDTSAAPPLFPVSIQVCFAKQEKKAKGDGLDSEVGNIVPTTSDKQVDFGLASVPVPLPLISSNVSPSAPMKSSRRSHRESNFFSGRYQRSKDYSNHHSRVSSSNSSSVSFGYQMIPSHSSSPNSGGGFEVMGNSGMGNSMMGMGTNGGATPMMGSNIGGASGFHGNFQERNSPLSDMSKNSGGHDGETENNSICLRNAGGGGSSSSSSGISRKRSVSSFTSGYHSYEKGSPSSPEFSPWHLQAMVAQGPHFGGSGPRHGQALMSSFHSVMREKEATFAHASEVKGQRSKKAKSVDQSMEAKQN